MRYKLHGHKMFMSCSTLCPKHLEYGLRSGTQFGAQQIFVELKKYNKYI